MWVYYPAWLMCSLRAGVRRGPASATNLRPRRRAPIVVVVIALVVATIPSVPGAEGATRRRVRARVVRATRRPPALTATQIARAKVRDKQVRVASHVNALKATTAQVTRSLRVLNANVQSQSVRLSHARKSAVAASVGADAARAREGRMACLA